MEENKQPPKKAASFGNNFYMLRMLWEICPARVILGFLNALANFGVWVFFSVIFMKYLFGAAEVQRSFEDTALFVGCAMAALLVLAALVSWYEKRYAQLTDQKLYYELNRRLFEKATTVDISCYENPEFYDSYTKATAEVYTRAVSVLNNMSQVVGALLASVYVIYTMFSINVWAGFFAFLPVTGNFLFGKFANKLYYKRDMDNVPFKRRQDYVNRAVYLQKFSKEVRLTNIYHVLRDTYQASYRGVCSNTEKYWKRLFTIEGIKSVICFPLVFEGLWMFAAYSAMVSKSILVGDFVVLANAIVSTTWMLMSLANGIVASYNNGLYIGNLKEFMGYREKIPEDQPGLAMPANIETLELRGVCFRYEGADRDVLQDINLTIRAGEKISVVGHNGAGKSTLVKLIMRLYDPTQGEIHLNGVDIRKYDLKEYRRRIGTTFQDFQMFSMSVVENVVMGKVNHPEQRERAIRALRESGVYEKVETLPKREDTILTREFDDAGAVLSGGQFQKIAVARAFAKECPIVLLDEPSSALDPVAEYEMYETIMKLCNTPVGRQQKLSVIISHRLSSAAMADTIYLFENGRIIERGNHRELMRQNGSYADMFRKQAENYLQEVVLDEA